VAIEAADVALMKDKLSNIVDLIKLSNKTMAIVWQNLFLWLAINTVGLILVFTGVLNPGGAAAYNFITDFIPLFNSLRIFLIRI
jgi:cation transport ATPase